MDGAKNLEDLEEVLLRCSPDEEVTEQDATNILKQFARKCFISKRYNRKLSKGTKKTTILFWGPKISKCLPSVDLLFQNKFLVTFCGSLLQSLLTVEFSCCHHRVVFWKDGEL